jgi:aryl-alcohol dehydrogenase-like predicted oxidoreductase
MSLVSCSFSLYSMQYLIICVRSIVASKCGFDVFGPVRSVTNSAAHINEYIDGTIERLGFAPDLYYLHRIDPSMLYNMDMSILLTEISIP